MPEPPLRVGLNLLHAVEGAGGAGTYARELIGALLEEDPSIQITALVPRNAPRWVSRSSWSAEIDTMRLPVFSGRERTLDLPLSLSAQWAMVPAIAASRRLHVVHGLANVSPPICPRAATVVTVLDLIWLRFPRTMTRRATLAMRAVTAVALRRADRIIAISSAVRDDLVDTLRASADKLDVTPLGVRVPARAASSGQDVLRARLGLGDRPVVMCVAQKREHKNLIGLVRALARAADPELMLVVPGLPTPHEAQLRAEAHRLGVAQRLVLSAWLSDQELEDLYGLARCLVLPSFDEGFGLPVLEAMARGVPVGCSDIPALREVAGDCALLFDPHDVGAIARAIDRLVADEATAEGLRRRGRERAAEFSWSDTARATLDSYRRAIAGRATGWG